MKNTNNLYRKRCINDWKWMQENCLGMYITDAKDALCEHRYSKKEPYYQCWACRYAIQLRGYAQIKTCVLCPVRWGNDIRWCGAVGSPYRVVSDNSVTLTKENTQAVIDVIEKTWEIK